MVDDRDVENFTAYRIDHLKMIQAVITRMSSNSATIKRYAIIITAAAISFAKALGAPNALLFTPFVILVFGLLDAYYLRLERRFRDLYDEVRVEPPTKRPDFRLTPPQPNHGLLAVAKTWPVAGLYAAMIALMLALRLLSSGGAS